jgi:hypothetical protein
MKGRALEKVGIKQKVKNSVKKIGGGVYIEMTMEATPLFVRLSGCTEPLTTAECHFFRNTIDLASLTFGILLVKLPLPVCSILTAKKAFCSGK